MPFTERTVIDYLWSIDPSGQIINGYAWSHTDGSRPDNIYDVYGSGQYPPGTGVWVSYAKEYVQTVRAPATRNPIRIAGPGYNLYGDSFGLTRASGHGVFVDNIPVQIYEPTSGIHDYRVGPLDIRYDEHRHVYTAPYNCFVAKITAVAQNGQAYKPDLTLTNTLPVTHYYSVASGLYRYKAQPYTIPEIENQNYSNFALMNVAELNNDYPYLRLDDKIIVMKNPSLIASGTFLCNERPVGWACFI